MNPARQNAIAPCDPLREDIGREGAAAFRRYWRACQRDPLLMQRHQERRADLLRRRAERQSIKGGTPSE